MFLGLSVEAVVKAVSMTALPPVRFARPGMQPSFAHEPNATSTWLFWRSSLAICSFSSLRIPPLKRHNRMDLSSIASTSLYLASIATGQNTTSKFASTSRIFSAMFRTAISQPPHEAAQYIANLGLAMPSSLRRCLNLNNVGRRRHLFPIQRPQRLDIGDKLVNRFGQDSALGGRCPYQPDAI